MMFSSQFTPQVCLKPKTKRLPIRADTESGSTQVLNMLTQTQDQQPPIRTLRKDHLWPHHTVCLQYSEHFVNSTLTFPFRYNFMRTGWSASAEEDCMSWSKAPEQPLRGFCAEAVCELPVPKCSDNVSACGWSSGYELNLKLSWGGKNPQICVSERWT